MGFLRWFLTFTAASCVGLVVWKAVAIETVSYHGRNGAVALDMSIIVQMFDATSIDYPGEEISLAMVDAKCFRGFARDTSSPHRFWASPWPYGRRPRAIMIVCDRAYAMRRPFGGGYGHAVAYTDGTFGLLSRREFAALDRSQFVALDDFARSHAAGDGLP
jgi:hypothetical protein